MKKTLAILLCLVCASAAFAQVKATKADFARSAAFRKQLPFSFVYNGKSSLESLSGWNKKQLPAKKFDGGKEYTAVWTDPATKFEVKYVRKEFSDFPATEWIVYFTNNGTENSGVLEEVKSIDRKLSKSGEFTINWDKGGINAPDAFRPMADTVASGDTKHYEPLNGRGTNSVSGYFNFAYGDCHDIICVGWPGQWAADISVSDDSYTMKAGQQSLKDYLKPGETIRTPRMLALFASGDYINSQNLWRRFYFAHVTPKVDGKPPVARFNMCMDVHNPDNVDEMIAKGCKPDYYWRDAGWYPRNGEEWFRVGNWVMDPEHLEGQPGMKPFFDRCHERGIKTILWFEPERIFAGNGIYDTKPEYVLKGDAYANLMDYANPEVVDYLFGAISKILKENSVDVYREDFNMDPLGFWNGRNTADRIGFQENLHIQGHFRLWDSLKEQGFCSEIDSCASGGLRNDYDTMTRALPFLRTDYEWAKDEAEYFQASFHGSAFWLPLGGIGMRGIDLYDFRSTFGGIATGVWTNGINIFTDEPYDFTLMKKVVEDLRAVQQYYTGDFYPLTEYSTEKNIWCVWQFDKPEMKGGVLQFFRRKICETPTFTANFRGLNPKGKYQLIDLDKGPMGIYTGAALADGLVLKTDKPKTSGLIVYKRVK
ncbi:MAG: alpha-galactosidase [Abditibacteriota bacterium]|nr:alpha-galactosidase [Abditibacteriota bacterium]